jgi:zeaxanthin glucosyltransferase
MNIAFLTLPAVSHISQMCSLASKLDNGSNKFYFFNIIDVRNFIEKQGFYFHAIGIKKFPEGSFEKIWKRDLKSNSIITGIKTLLNDLKLCDIFINEIPDLLKGFRIDLLIIDQLIVYGKAIALRAGVKFITMAISINIYPDSGYYPPGYSWWNYSPENPLYAGLNILSKRIHNLFSGLFIHRAKKLLKRNNLPFNNIEQSSSDFGVIDLLPAELDYPRKISMDKIHYIGPLIKHNFDNVSCKFNSLDKPRIYVSFGTMNSNSVLFFKKLIDILGSLKEYQFILSKGNWNDKKKSKIMLNGNITICSFVNQIELLKNTDIMITHGGKTTVSECLYFGIPMLCIPADYDQFAISARVAYHKFGRKISRNSINKTRINSELNELLMNPLYKANCLKASDSIRSCDQKKIIYAVINKVFGLK